MNPEKPDQSITMASGEPVDPNHRELDPETGLQKGYLVLSEDERAKGFIRPYRDSYTHRVCGVNTKMGKAIAETYARDPKFYNGTFCAGCRKHFPLSEFVWRDTLETVGS